MKLFIDRPSALQWIQNKGPFSFWNKKRLTLNWNTKKQWNQPLKYSHASTKEKNPVKPQETVIDQLTTANSHHKKIQNKNKKPGIQTDIRKQNKTTVQIPMKEVERK